MQHALAASPRVFAGRTCAPARRAGPAAAAAGARCGSLRAQSSRNMREAMSPTSQSKAASSPSPVTALHATTRAWRPRPASCARPSASASASSDSAPAMSCLLASTSSVAPASCAGRGNVSNGRLATWQRGVWGARLFLGKECAQLRRAVRQARGVRGVHHPHQPVRGFVVIAPVGAQRLLAAHVPHVQRVPAVDRASAEPRCSGARSATTQRSGAVLQPGSARRHTQPRWGGRACHTSSS